MGRRTALAALAALAASVAASAAAQTVTVEGAQFRVTLAGGRVLPQSALPGTVLTLGDGSLGGQRRVRIDAVTPDPKDPVGEIMLYTLSRQDPQSGEWRNLCRPDPEGRQAGFPLAGAFTADMRYVSRPGTLLITCVSGAEGKCIRFGYKPWGRAADGTPLAPYYQACVRLVRADYCGDGIGHTRDGTSIDIFDRIGVQHDEPGPGMSLEAAWGPDGAICVRHTRLSQPALAAIATTCPRLASHVGDRCDETAPALLYNRSVPP
jgi:ADYC domain